jgi:hypothetical protein
MRPALEKNPNPDGSGFGMPKNLAGFPKPSFAAV